MRHFLIISSLFVCTLIGCWANKNSSTKVDSKKYSMVILQQIHDVFSIVDVNTENQVEVDDIRGEKVFSKIGVFTTDSILIYNYLNSPITKNTPSPLIVSLNPSSEVERCTLHFFIDSPIENMQTRDSVDIVFEPNNTIKIGTDCYVVNSAYYEYLKKQVLMNLNVICVITLMKNIPSKYIEYISQVTDNLCVTKENINHKIQKVVFNTISTQSDIIQIWNASYTYDDNGLLTNLVILNNKSDLLYEKKLLYSDTNTKNYSVFYNSEDRTVLNSLIFTDMSTLLDSLSCINYQTGLNLEYSYNIYPISRHEYDVDKLNLNGIEIVKVIGDLF